jgi:hypothetical protein
MTSRGLSSFRHCKMRAITSVALTQWLAGCAPTANIAGVYVPGWLLATLLGIVGAYAIVVMLARRAATRALGDSGLFFLALVALLSMASWWALYSAF